MTEVLSNPPGCSRCSPHALMMDRVDAYERAVALIRNARDGGPGVDGVVPQSELNANDILALARFLAGVEA